MQGHKLPHGMAEFIHLAMIFLSEENQIASEWPCEPLLKERRKSQKSVDYPFLIFALTRAEGDASDACFARQGANLDTNFSPPFYPDPEASVESIAYTVMHYRKRVRTVNIGASVAHCNGPGEPMRTTCPESRDSTLNNRSFSLTLQGPG